MELNILERITILQILPQEGNFTTLKIVRDLQASLAPSEEEFKEFEIKQVDNMTTWNEKGREGKEITIGEKASDVVMEALEKLDKEKKLTANHISIYEKFIKD